MKIIKTQKTKICPNCMSKVIEQTKFNTWFGWKIRDGSVFCKMCGKEIK
jgi:RNase P subunit RPR2